MGEVYKMNIAGCERELPICPLNEHMDIAGFVMFSDVEITERAAQALLEKCPEHDVIVTAESKGIPLAYEALRPKSSAQCCANPKPGEQRSAFSGPVCRDLGLNGAAVTGGKPLCQADAGKLASPPTASSNHREE